MRKFFLRDRQRFAASGIQDWIKKRRQLSRYPGFGPKRPVVLNHANEVAKALIQLDDEELVKRYAAVEQQRECPSRVPKAIVLLRRAMPS